MRHSSILRLLRLARSSLLVVFFGLAWPVLAQPPEPLTFFTKAADRLLRAHLGLSVQRIPIAPTNQYNLETHRLLQVAANLYDATTPDPFPSVFRPIVGVDPLNPGGLAITNFVYDLDEATISSWFQENGGYGLPLIIGAKKGIPNFNEYVVQTTALCARKLELRRTGTNAAVARYETNQMYILGVSNFFAVEAWNSYTNTLGSNLPISDVTVAVGSVVSLTLTNDDGLYYVTNLAFGTATNVLAQNWSGYQPRVLTGGFMVPLATNLTLLANSVYRTDPPRFEPTSFNAFDRGKGFPVPQWHMTSSNRLVFVLHTGGRILDFVSLDDITERVNLTELLMELNPNAVNQIDGGVIASCWRTNRLGNAPLDAFAVPTEGIVNQLQISVAEPQIGASDWSSFNFGGPALSISQIQAQIDAFRSFLGLPPLWNQALVNTNLVVQAPFSPARKLVRTTTWQANDPLVHHMIEHLKDATNNTSLTFIKPLFSPAAIALNLSNLNRRFRPWGGNPASVGHPNAANQAVKDPGVFVSDDWTFPIDLLSVPGLIGRVHRGTPWQTIYLKSEAAGPWTWSSEFLDARSHPTNDWRSVGVLLPLLATNEPQNQFSVNEPNTAAWRQILHGMTVLSNAMADPLTREREFVAYTMQSNSPQAEFIAQGIQQARAARNPPYFPRVGDILSTPELTVASPWLNTATELERTYGLTDRAYEAIPEQLLPLLRVGPVLTVRRQTDRTEIRIEGSGGDSYELQASANLYTWTTIAIVFPDPLGVAVAHDTSGAHHFYRARLAAE